MSRVANRAERSFPKAVRYKGGLTYNFKGLDADGEAMYKAETGEELPERATNMIMVEIYPSFDFELIAGWVKV